MALNVMCYFFETRCTRIYTNKHKTRYNAILRLRLVCIRHSSELCAPLSRLLPFVSFARPTSALFPFPVECPGGLLPGAGRWWRIWRRRGWERTGQCGEEWWLV